MRNTLETLSSGYSLYTVRRPEYFTADPIPFRISPFPFELTSTQAQEIRRIGSDICDYVTAVTELYKADGRVRLLLDKGKPEIFLTENAPTYLFYRPDLIITPDGFAVCEIETSPFGLAIAHLLNSASLSEGYATMVGEEQLPQHITSGTSVEGAVVYSQTTKSYSGQLAFLADRIFSGDNRRWHAASSHQVSDTSKPVYRGFYLAEYLDDPQVKLLLDNAILYQTQILPSLTPYLEEKAILALLWDKRWEEILRRRLGDTIFSHLRQVIPPTWIVGEEQYFSPGLPNGVSQLMDLAGLSRSKRTLVLKTSGFNNQCSWGEGVTFLHQKSQATVRQLLTDAANNQCSLSIIQDFKEGARVSLLWEDGKENRTLIAKIRLTPYFSPKDAKLLAIKATGCAGTDYIHATTASVNTAVVEAPVRIF